MSISCPECGKDASANDSSCPHCGFPLDHKESIEQKRDNETEGESQEDENREGSSKGFDSSDEADVSECSLDSGAGEESEKTETNTAESTVSDGAEGPRRTDDSKEIKDGISVEEIAKKISEVKNNLSKPVIAAICVGVAVLLGIFVWAFMICHHNEWKPATCTEPRTCASCGLTEGEPLAHKWRKATCAAPKTCADCGLTEGEPLEHEWKDATCTEPKKCALCGQTSGDALGHELGEYEVTTEPTCAAEGEETAVCSVCGESVTRKVEKTEHTPGDWEVTKEPVVSGGEVAEEGERIYKCTVCGEQLGQEKFTMTAEELKESFMGECESYSYDSIARDPDSYEGSKATFSGKVLQVVEGFGNQIGIRLATSGGYDNVLYVTYTMQEGQSRILEDDTITVYGSLTGLYSYKATLGQTITIPSMSAQYVE